MYYCSIVSVKKILVVLKIEIGDPLNKRHLLNKHHRCSSETCACVCVCFSFLFLAIAKKLIPEFSFVHFLMITSITPLMHKLYTFSIIRIINLIIRQLLSVIVNSINKCPTLFIDYTDDFDYKIM